MSGGTNTATYDFTVPDAVGKTVRIVMASNEILNMYEVEVYSDHSSICSRSVSHIGNELVLLGPDSNQKYWVRPIDPSKEATYMFQLRIGVRDG